MAHHQMVAWFLPGQTPRTLPTHSLNTTGKSNRLASGRRLRSRWGRRRIKSNSILTIPKGTVGIMQIHADLHIKTSVSHNWNCWTRRPCESSCMLEFWCSTCVQRCKATLLIYVRIGARAIWSVTSLMYASSTLKGLWLRCGKLGGLIE
jgi:hypothetical protein